VVRAALDERPRKVAGILCEAVKVDAAYQAVIGVGLNVSAEHFDPPLDRSATSLALLEPHGPLPSLEALLVDILVALEARTKRFESEGLAAFNTELEAADALAGRTVSVDGRPTRAVGIDADGCLVVENDGIRRKVRAGTVEFPG
jgi:biotin-(acetyl-CoA carboxylase) ligase